MNETTKIRRTSNGAIDIEFYHRTAHALRSEAFRSAASSFARFIKRSFKAWKSWRIPAPEFPTHFASPAE